ncbi:AraC family transcriptional regulator [Pseudomonas sp. PvP001]|uniref:AraC family transcriptional regulator n=1 Tax=Pseudomonas sp. PvP001 TaxID=3158559 RepID=UPI0033960C6E
MNSKLNELRTLAAIAENRRTKTGIPRVAMVKGKIPEHMLAAVYDPMINLILRGSKTMKVATVRCGTTRPLNFVMSIKLPAVGAVHPAVTGEPYLAVSFTLDPMVLTTLLADLLKPAGRHDNDPGFSVAATTPELMDAWVRMLRLMASLTTLRPSLLHKSARFCIACCKGPMARCCGISRRPTRPWPG